MYCFLGLRAEGLGFRVCGCAEKLRGLLFGVGFHNNKTTFLKEAAEILIKKHKGEVPQTLDDLMQLRGVGRKMANIVMHAVRTPQNPKP